MDSNSSSGVVQSQVHENDEQSPNNVASQPVAHSEEKPHEMRLFLNKVKAKAKKFTDTFKKHDPNVPDDQHHIPDDHHDLDEDEEMDEDQEVHETPIHESEVVRSATPTSGQLENLGKSGVSFGGTTVKGEEPHHKPRVVGVSPTTESNQNITTDPAKTFVGEEESGQIGLEEDPHASRSRPEAYTPPKYQTKVTDLTGAGTGDIDIAPVEKSFARLNVQDEPKHSPEPKVLPNVTEPQSRPAGSHNQFVPELSTETTTQDPSAESHDRYMPELSSVTKTENPYAKSHEQYNPELSSVTKTQDPSTESHDQYMPELPSATKTQYPSAGSHDQFEPDFSTAAKTQYPSDESHDQFALETASTGTNSYNQNSEAAEKTFNTNTTKVEEQPSYESLEKPSRQSSYTTKVTDLTGPGTGEIDIAPVEKSFARLNVQDEQKPSAEPKVLLPNVDETKTQDPSAESHDQYMPELCSETKTQYPSARSHDQFEPDFSTAAKTQYPSDESHDQFALETVSPGTNRYHENSEAAEQTFNTNTTKVEEQPSYESVEKPSSQSSYTDKAVSAKHAVDSKLGYGEKGDREDKVTIHDEQKKSGDASNMSGSTAEYGKNIDHSLTEKLAPDHGNVEGVGSEEKSKLSGTGTGTGTNTAVGTETENVVKEQKKGASVKDYLAEKLRPGEEDKVLSEVISEALHKRKEEPKKDSGDEDKNATEVISDDKHKREEETVEKEHGYLGSGDEKSEKVSEESSVNSPGKGVVDRLKDVYGSWFGKSVENQSTEGDEGLSKSKDSGSEVEQVSKVEGEKRLQE